MWEEALAGIQKHLIATTKHSNLKIVAELPTGIGDKLLPKMDHLACFLPGAIALGATHGSKLADVRHLTEWNTEREEQIQLARDIMKTCWGMYAVTNTGLAPEIAYFDVEDDQLQPNPGDRPSSPTKNSLKAWKDDFIIKPADAHNLQRPETVESLLIMWRITGDPLYREWGWKIFKAFRRYTYLGEDQGYTSINNVNAIPTSARDGMESFWLVSFLISTMRIMLIRTG